MAWVKVDDQFFFKPRARQAGPDGRALFFAGLCYCAANRTDGRIVKPALPLVAGMAEVGQDIALLLCDIGLWVEHDLEFEVIDFLKFNPSRAQLEADAAAAAERQAKSRAKSRRDSHSDVGVSATAPSPLPSHESSSSSSGQENTPGLPPSLWTRVAERQMAATSSKVANPAAWLRKAAANARADLTDRAVTLLEHYELTDSQLIDVLLSPSNPAWLSGLRRKESA